MPEAFKLSIDRLILRFEFNADRLDGEVIASNRHAANVATRLHGSSSADRATLVLPLFGEGQQHAGSVAVRVFLPVHTATAGTVSGAVSFNPLNSLREILGDAAAGPAGLDGKRNVIGATGAFPEIERTCLDLVAAATDRALLAVRELLGPRPTFSGAQLWLSAFEATRDLPMLDARDKAHRVAHAVIDRALFVERTLYRDRVGTMIDRGNAVSRFYDTKTGAAVKVYAKREDLLRIEWVLDERDAVRRETDGCRVELSGEGARRLVEAALDLARASLGVAEPEVLSVCRGEATPATVALALGPLLGLASPDQPAVRGRPPAIPVHALARRAYSALILTGQCTVTGEGERGRLRKCLEGLVTDGVLVRKGAALCYRLASGLVSGISRYEIPDEADRELRQA